MTQDSSSEVPPWGSPDAAAHPVPPGTPQGHRGAEPDPELRCPLCSGTAFSEEEGKVETRWGMSKHVLTMKVCRRCSHVLFFYQAGASPF